MTKTRYCTVCGCELNSYQTQMKLVKCGECGEMGDDEHKRLTKELKELVEQWRADGRDLVEKTDRESLQSNGRARLGCADQVEQLINHD